MNKQNVLAFALVMATGFVGGALASPGRSSEPAQTQQKQEQKKADARDWEYCWVRRPELRGWPDKPVIITHVSYWRTDSFLDQTFEVEQGRAGDIAETEKIAQARLMAKLGSEGWELVGQGPILTVNSNPPPTVIYFKRSKQ